MSSQLISQKRHAVELRDASKPMREVAQLLGVREACVSRWTKIPEYETVDSCTFVFKASEKATPSPQHFLTHDHKPLGATAYGENRRFSLFSFHSYAPSIRWERQSPQSAAMDAMPRFVAWRLWPMTNVKRERGWMPNPLGIRHIPLLSGSGLTFDMAGTAMPRDQSAPHNYRDRIICPSLADDPSAPHKLHVCTRQYDNSAVPITNRCNKWNNNNDERATTPQKRSISDHSHNRYSTQSLGNWKKAETLLAPFAWRFSRRRNKMGAFRNRT